MLIGARTEPLLSPRRMPIIERTPKACCETFRAHIAGLISKTLTARYPVRIVQTDVETEFTLEFPPSEASAAVPIGTKFGKLYFYVAQALETVEEKPNRYRLQTRRYWYRLQREKGYRDPALIRWEYDREDLNPALPKSPRHHVQIAAEVERPKLDLDKLHLPTGWVTIEEVIRFLIADLGVKPLCGKRWPHVLSKSEAVFFTDFTSKRYVPEK